MDYSINQLLKVLYPYLETAVSEMITYGWDNPDSRELVAYKPGYKARTRIAYKDQEPELTNDEKLIKWLTEDKYKIDFIKISTRITDKTYYSYNYTMEEISAPLLNNRKPISGSVETSCIYIPDDEFEIPLTNVNIDSSLWDLSGNTITIGRFNEAKYTCDQLDIINNNTIKSYNASIPMQYNGSNGIALPNPKNIISLSDDFVKIMSLFIFEQRGEYSSKIYDGRFDPIFNGIYVTPLIMLYYNIVDFRDRALALQ